MTAKNIAEQLGISPATVSLALNNKPGVSQETRKKIMELARQGRLLEKRKVAERPNILFLEYRKNGNGSNQSYFAQIFSGVIEGVERQARYKNCDLSIVTADSKSLSKTIENINPASVHGLLVLATEMDDDQILTFEKKRIPTIVLDNYIESADLNSVTINNEQGVELAIAHLIEMGHSNIGYVHVEGDAVNFNERYYGFKRSMENHGMVVKDQNILRFSTLYGGEAVYFEIQRLVREVKYMPTAFFADNDIIAICLIKALKDLGLRVPEDVSVVGFDNIPMSELLDPPLTTVSTSKHEIGSCAVNQLINLMDGKLHGIQKTEIKSKLIIRASVRQMNWEEGI